MYADRYAPRRLDRGSLGMSVGIVGGLVAAAMLSPTVIEQLHPDKPLITYVVKPTPTPPPDPRPKPAPQARTKAGPVIDKPIVTTPAAPDQPYVGPPEQPYTGTPGTGEGPGPATVIDPPKPPPVITGSEVDLRYARDFQPLYPPAEQRAGRDGVVTLKVLVGVDGRVVRAEQVLATSDEFWRVTLRQALARWRFKPATRDGVAFEQWRTMTVRFNLEGQ